jgi:hypothetical protein
MELVDPDVTREKFDRELELWSENQEAYRRRGWIMLGRSDLTVDIGFLGKLPIGIQVVPSMSACIRVEFCNYDVWAPSVEFIDPVTGEYATPIVQALVDSAEGPRDILVNSHPTTNRPFLCVPGVRQYHDHPQHSGDSWLLHRKSGAGSLATICDRVWMSMARNLLGVHVELQTVPGQLQVQLRVVNAPGEVAPAMWEQAELMKQAALAAAADGSAPVAQPGPPQILAALGIPAPSDMASEQ